MMVLQPTTLKMVLQGKKQQQKQQHQRLSAEEAGYSCQGLSRSCTGMVVRASRHI
jgi:hypothetical protein